MAFCTLYVSLQVGLSLRGLTSPGHFRFAWGMYTVVSALPAVDIVYRGSVEGNVAGRFLALEARPEINYGALLPAYICSAVKAAEAVYVDHRAYPCHR
jgi:hypothetical protein